MRQAVVALMIVGAALLGPATVLAGSIETADQLHAQGKQLFDAGQYQQALDKFTLAYSTYPQAKYVFAIANCYVKLENLPRALDAYEMFTQYEATPDVLKKVEGETAKLKSMLSREYGEVFIFSSPSEAQIIIDEISKQNVYTTPTRRWLKEGAHTIFFKKDGCRPHEVKVSIKRGEHIYIYAGLKQQ